MGAMTRAGRSTRMIHTLTVRLDVNCLHARGIFSLPSHFLLTGAKRFCCSVSLLVDAACMRIACSRLNIAPHNVGMPRLSNGAVSHAAQTLWGCADIEGHRVNDPENEAVGRCYVLDSARLFPPLRQPNTSMGCSYRLVYVPSLDLPSM